MVRFLRVAKSRLYQSDGIGSDGDWWGFLLGEGIEPPAHSIPLKEALNNDGLKGSFVYTAKAPNLDKTDQFIDKIAEIIKQKFNNRVIIFLASGASDEIIPDEVKTVISFGRSNESLKVTVGINVTLTGVEGIDANVASNSKLTVPEEAGDNYIKLDGGSRPALTLSGSLAPEMVQPNDNLAFLHFAGPSSGALTFSLFMSRGSLFSRLNWGFQLMIRNNKAQNEITGNGAVPFLAAWLPLAARNYPSSKDNLGFNAQINLVNPRNQIERAAKTIFYFTGKDPSGLETFLISYYRTNYGKKINLYPVTQDTDGQAPAGLVINSGHGKTPNQNGFRFAPIGDFIAAVDGAVTGKPEKLLLGLSGTEAIAFLPEIKGQSGARFRFIANKPAFAPQFPLQQASPVGPPLDANAMLLDCTFQTSWATIISSPGDSGNPHYIASPKGSELFGRDEIVAPVSDGLLGPKEPGFALPNNAINFPILPLAGFEPGTGEQDLTSDDLERMETQIISPTRRAQITPEKSHPSVSSETSLGLIQPLKADSGFNVTTPTGFIAHIDSSGNWTQLLLAQMMEEKSGLVTMQMGFTKLLPELQSAFQTDNLFLIVANSSYLGSPGSGTFMPPAKKCIDDKTMFFNQISIDEWIFESSTGQNNRYGDYRNIIIVKGVKGRIRDLVISPDKWTMKTVFAAPSVNRQDEKVSDPDVSQLIPLSAWLNAYFDEAINKRDNPYFSGFCNIIEDENWNGVLILKADIAHIPPDLAGIKSGVSNLSDFFAHHIGIEISQIEGTNIEQKDSTSIFGLVYYVDPRYDDGKTTTAIAPSDMNAEYDFALLTLKVLFRNSSVKMFESLAQVIVNRIFGSGVLKMEGEQKNPYNAIILEGNYQKNGDMAIYSLASKSTNSYYLDNNIITKVEIDSAELSTREVDSTGNNTVSWIGLSGYMNFAVIGGSHENDPQPGFDIFSFGSDKNQDRPREGLNFKNLGLEISSKKSQGDDAPAKEMSMVESEISFNTSPIASRLRENSLFLNFQLELLGLQSGDENTTPSDLGYMTVATPYGLQGVSSGRPWHALRFKLNLGTPGALASKVNLNSSLLMAWSDDSGAQEGSSGYQVFLGIELPGIGSDGRLFSLQTVIKLSIGSVQLFYNKEQESFLLLMNEIAMKLFGLLKIPPGGNTAFFLFGNKNATQSTGLGWYAIYNQEQKKEEGTV